MKYDVSFMYNKNDFLQESYITIVNFSYFWQSDKLIEDNLCIDMGRLTKSDVWDDCI